MRSIKKDWQRQSQSESEDDDMVGKKDLMPLVMSQGDYAFQPKVGQKLSINNYSIVSNACAYLAIVGNIT